MGQKILITGGAGYIGSHIVELLLSRGFQCIIIDNLSTGHQDSVLGGILIKGDIQDEQLIKKIFQDHPEIKSAMHFAASILPQESIKKPFEYYENNFLHAMKFLKTAIDCGLKNLIFSSTASVYGEKKDGLCSETDIPQPLHPYGRSKLMFEWLLSDLAYIQKIKYVALRYFNVVGASSSGKLGQKSKQISHLLKRAVETASGKRSKMFVFGDDYPTPDGTCIRDFIHVEDLAQLHLKALEYINQGGSSQILNCGSEQGISVKELISTLKQETGTHFQVEITGRRKGDLPKIISKIDKIKKVLAWEPSNKTLEMIVRSAYEFEKHL